MCRHTSSNRLLLSNQDKGCTPSVAHSLPLPLGPALLNLSIIVRVDFGPWLQLFVGIFYRDHKWRSLAKFCISDFNFWFWFCGDTGLFINMIIYIYECCKCKSFRYHQITKIWIIYMNLFTWINYFCWPHNIQCRTSYVTIHHCHGQQISSRSVGLMYCTVQGPVT